METKFFVYILKCSDETFYTGYTVDINARFKKHSAGKGAKYTRSRLPLILCYLEECSTKSEAMKREYQIKKLSRKEKEFLIKK